METLEGLKQALEPETEKKANVETEDETEE